MPKLQLLNKYLFITLCFVILTGLFTRPVFAGTLGLNPSSQIVTLNSPFSVTLVIDTKGENTTATDVVLTFDPAYLEILSVDYIQPSLYPTNTKVLDNTAGKIRLTSTHEDAVNSYKGSGSLATLRFNPKTVGTTSVVFTCEVGKTNDTNMFKKGTSTDIIECGNLVNGLYTISQTGTGTIPTTAPRSTLPTSGNIGPTGLILIGGAALLGIGVALVLLL